MNETDLSLVRDLKAFMTQIRETNRVPEDWWAPSGRAWREVEDAAEKTLAEPRNPFKEGDTVQHKGKYKDLGDAEVLRTPDAKWIVARWGRRAKLPDGTMVRCQWLVLASECTLLVRRS